MAVTLRARCISTPEHQVVVLRFAGSAFGEINFSKRGKQSASCRRRSITAGQTKETFCHSAARMAKINTPPAAIQGSLLPALSSGRRHVASSRVREQRIVGRSSRSLSQSSDGPHGQPSFDAGDGPFDALFDWGRSNVSCWANSAARRGCCPGPMRSRPGWLV